MTTATLPHALASRFARLVLAGVHREYPNKLDHVLNGPDSLKSPRALHPAFYGCFDWHSAVHGHWLLARILRLLPALPEAPAIRAALNTSLTPANIAVETAYLSRPNSGSFERTYGWAWLLKLAEELALADNPSWGKALAPLADAFINRYLDYLPRADYPIRSGVHPNTAFGLAFALDFAAASHHAPLLSRVRTAATTYFADDENYPAHLEPGGSDFFSPALMEADLMRRVLEPGDFTRWLARFLTGIASGEPASLFNPVLVSDRKDLQIVHLDGLNLSRAWSLRSIAAALSFDDPARPVMLASAERHAQAALPHIATGDYGGDHWLATFAVLALTGA